MNEDMLVRINHSINELNIEIANINNTIVWLENSYKTLLQMYEALSLKVGFLHNDKKKKPDMIKPNKHNIFEFMPIDQYGTDQINYIRGDLYDLYSWVMINISENRERNIGIRKLEEAAMWLNKAISRRNEYET